MKALIQIIIPILSIICFNDCCSVNKIVGKSFCVHLELQNGFDNDSIVVMIDGNQNIIVDSVDLPPYDVPTLSLDFLPQALASRS